MTTSVAVEFGALQFIAFPARETAHQLYLNKRVEVGGGFQMLFHGVLGGLVVFAQFEVVHSQLAPAYHVDGAFYSSHDGIYYRMATAQCNGKPVYQRGGRAWDVVLFQPDHGTLHGYKWMIGPSDHATTCPPNGYISSHSQGSRCPASPDSGSCSGKWVEYMRCGDDDESSWCHRPELSVQAVQCATVCGPHGSVSSSSGGRCECTCESGAYTGDRCQNYDPCALVDCGSHGSCIRGSCECQRGYSGDTCQTFDPCYDVQCGEHGSCVRGSCECQRGYSGDTCQTFDPCYDVQCGEHGTCSGGTCTCESGAYTGDQCQVYDPCGLVDCGSHGSCIRGSCECQRGYSGDTCQTFDCLSEYVAIQDSLFTGCCADGCPTGAPTSCSDECSAVVLPYAESCGESVRDDPDLVAVLDIIGMCSESSAPVGPDCLQMLVDREEEINSACCVDATDCPDGEPTTCSEMCANVLEPYFEICSGWVKSDPNLSPILEPLIGACEDAKFGDYRHGLFSHRCSTIKKQQFLSTTLPAACCGANDENCPDTTAFLPPPTTCTPQCAPSFEEFYSECHPSFDGTPDAPAFDAFLALCQAQPPPGH